MGSLLVQSGQLEKPFESALKRGAKQGLVPAIMKRKPGVFSDKTAIRKLIKNRLGWVDSAKAMKKKVAGIESFGKQVFRDRLQHVVLMGMGGSSLCPELLGLMFGRHPRLKSYSIIDSTDPAAIAAVERKIDIKRTLFVVASKSGGTVETRSQEAYFLGKLRDAKVKNVGRHFVAITDPGSKLQADARKLKYRKVFLNPPDIGGRYSALSYFGLVPAYFAGIDLRTFLADAIVMQKLLTERSDAANPALALGALMAVGAKAGFDKLTFIASKKTAPLVPWIEQLVAESTGKKGKGVVPVEAEPLVKAAAYGKDRVFVTLRMKGEKSPLPPRLDDLVIGKRLPSAEITMADKMELGAQFLLWEAATAVAGAMLKLNPFDEPNVTESKSNTTKILAGFERIGSLPPREPMATWGKLTLISVSGKKRYTRTDLTSLKKLLARFLSGAKAPEYVSLLNYFKADNRTEKALSAARKTIVEKKKVASLRGYGPRYLHSIGQLYKGGPAEGRFIIFVRSRYGKKPIPGSRFGFDHLIDAQAIGDAQALAKRKLPALVIAIDGSPAAGLEYFTRQLRAALR